MIFAATALTLFHLKSKYSNVYKGVGAAVVLVGNKVVIPPFTGPLFSALASVIKLLALSFYNDSIYFAMI